VDEGWKEERTMKEIGLEIDAQEEKPTLTR